MDTRSLRSKASQETLVSLLQLDPSPMESADPEKDSPPLPHEDIATLSEKSRSSTGVGLSGSGRNAIYYRNTFPSVPTNGATTG